MASAGFLLHLHGEVDHHNGMLLDQSNQRNNPQKGKDIHTHAEKKGSAGCPGRHREVNEDLFLSRIASYTVKRGDILD